MPYCAILECKNDSRKINLKNGGISYHRFPKEGGIKEKWINATGRVDWMPTKLSTICSEHFLEHDIIITKNGMRYIKPTAIPTSKIILFVDQQHYDTAAHSLKKSDCESCSSQPPKKRRISESSNNTCDLTEIDHYDVIQLPVVHSKSTVYSIHLEKKSNDMTASGSTSSTLKIRKLEAQLRFFKLKVKKQDLKIKRLQSNNRRLKVKIHKLDQVLTKLARNFDMSEENLDDLKNTNLEVKELIGRVVTQAESGVLTKKIYSPELRSFALTLYYYSPKAYNYVRQTFQTCLPHTRTVKSWYAKVGDPGFSKKSLVALKHEADTFSSISVSSSRSSSSDLF